MIPPVLVKPEAMEGTGFLGAHAAEVYQLPQEDLYLVGTSEVPLAALPHERDHRRELPRRYVAWSSCFRREAGSYGKDTRGIIRVHQFDKVEMFSYCDPGGRARTSTCGCSNWEKEMLAKVELPYRVIDTAARRPRLQRRAQVRLRGVGADAGALPRADLDLQLHRLPGPPPVGAVP